ncbi:hypothetical protein K491DRAFT_782398 [Lophiostoma macrostomum CBS 122681]|uniref:G-protein coupled receptors family 1 profile domain-containing protein n=1 Tax=Lophiostoma macrostomum CBS 122681 TaxID=1314788 RepID=A0A6A6SSK6_9PLEO|nr:hypothetical protein K491DRAFT_782398 [Lophiostoma macrostomum CBS 122681]
MAQPGTSKVPLAGNVISTILSMVTFGVLSICLVRRMQPITKWKDLPLATCLVLLIYIDSTLFVFATAVITRGFDINTSHQVCEGAILLCLVCYMTTKVLIYFFLVEKAYIVRGSRLPRFKTKLWLFNTFGMLVPYLVVIVMNFVWRIAYINDDGICTIGMKKISMLPLIIFEVIVNVYLTILFIIPLRKLYSYQHNSNKKLHSIAFRTFIGSCATLTSSVVNLTILMVLKGEPGWICLMCCNADILFSVLVLHWVTQIDDEKSTHNSSNGTAHGRPDICSSRGGIPVSRRGSTNIWSGSKRLSDGAGNKKVMGTLVTECKAVKMPGRGRDSEDEIVEMNQITVRTEHKTEIEIDGRSESERGDDYHGFGERSVSTEKMV